MIIIMKVLVTGAGGQLGHDVCKELKRRGIEHLGTTSCDMDITDKDAVKNIMQSYQPDAVIHCAAYTKVDSAEDEPLKAYLVNEHGTRNIAEACRKSSAKMLYISTDYVFPGDGTQFYETDSFTDPHNIYGKSKLAGEFSVMELADRYFIVRVSWVFGSKGSNFVKTMLRLSQTHKEVDVVCDQIGSPTYTVDLAFLLCDMIVSDRYGIYHATNEGVCSWAEFAEEIFRQFGKHTNVLKISSDQYPSKAKRPLNSRLSKKSLDRAGFSRLPCWQDAIERYFNELDDDNI